MPRYFFDLHEGRVVSSDDTGLAFLTDSQAIDEARKGIVDMAGEIVSDVKLDGWRTVTVVVLTEDRVEIARLTLSFSHSHGRTKRERWFDA